MQPSATWTAGLICSLVEDTSYQQETKHESDIRRGLKQIGTHASCPPNGCGSCAIALEISRFIAMSLARARGGKGVRIRNLASNGAVEWSTAIPIQLPASLCALRMRFGDPDKVI